VRPSHSDQLKGKVRVASLNVKHGGKIVVRERYPHGLVRVDSGRTVHGSGHADVRPLHRLPYGLKEPDFDAVVSVHRQLGL